MTKLELPLTVRLATKDDVPATESIIDNIKGGEQANIVEGYITHANTTHNLPFTFFSEININNSRLWDLFEALSSGLPSVSCMVYGCIDTEPFYSPYMDKSLILDKITQYRNELSLDGFLEFGLLYQDSEKLIEIFIKKAKYIQYWGTDESFFLKIMEDFSLKNIHNINFIDEYPIVTESLQSFGAEYVLTKEIIDDLINHFEK